MMPGLNPRKMEKMMKQMGIQQEDLGARRVVITLDEKEMVFENPSVQKVNMMGQQTFQIVGDYSEKSLETTPDITAEDIETVKAQVSASDEAIKMALEKNKGDIAQTIVDLSE